MRTITPLLFIISILAMVPVSHAHASPAPKLERTLKKEFGSLTAIIGRADVKAFRRSSFYSPIKSILALTFKHAQSGNKCLKYISYKNVDYGVIALTPKSKGVKASGYIAISGSFSAAKLLGCLARAEKWKKTTFKGYPAFRHKKDELYYSPGIGVLVAAKGQIAKTIDPRKGILGRGQLSKLKSSRFVAVDAKKIPGNKDFKTLRGYGKLGSKIVFKGSATFHTTKQARALMQKGNSLLGKSSYLYSLTKTLTLRRRGKTIKLNYTMDQTQLKFLISIVSMVMSRNAQNKAAPPTINNPTPRIIH